MSTPTLREAAQAPTTVRAEARECNECGHTGINDFHATDAACNHCEWSGPWPKEDHCPECERDGTMCLACPDCSGVYRLIAECDISVDRAALPQAADAVAPALYRSINLLLAHIGKEGSVAADHPLVWDTMTALNAVDGGVCLDSLAEPAGPTGAPS